MIESLHYKITKENFTMHELIGIKIKIIKSSDQTKEGLIGIIVNETKNTIIIENEGIEKILPKNEIEIEFDLNGEKVILDGKLIQYAPEIRTKSVWRNKRGRQK